MRNQAQLELTSGRSMREKASALGANELKRTSWSERVGANGASESVRSTNRCENETVCDTRCFIASL